jgi:hypothetical protein
MFQRICKTGGECKDFGQPFASGWLKTTWSAPKPPSMLWLNKGAGLSACAYAIENKMAWKMRRKSHRLVRLLH